MTPRYHSTRPHDSISGVRRSGLTWSDKFGSRILPMDDLRQLDRDRRVIGEPGPAFGTTIFLGSLSALLAAITLIFVIVFGSKLL